MRFLLLFLLCVIVGYMIYPYLNKSEAAVQAPLQVTELNIVLLNSVSQNEIVGSWALSPRSTGLLSNSLGTSGRRAGLNLESWGGGDANFIIDGRRIDGPIAWHSQPGVGQAPATLHIDAADDNVVLRFSKMENGLVLVAETERESGEKDYLRFLKAS